MLRVTVAEVNRTAARSIGLDFSVLNAAGTAVFSSTTGGLIPTTVTGMGSIGPAHRREPAGHHRQRQGHAGDPSTAKSQPGPIARRAESCRAQWPNGPIPRRRRIPRAGGDAHLWRRRPGSLVHSLRRPDAIRSRSSPTATVCGCRSERLSVRSTRAWGPPSEGVPGRRAQPFPVSTRARFKRPSSCGRGQTFAVAGLTQTTFGATTVRVPVLRRFAHLGIRWPARIKRRTASKRS